MSEIETIRFFDWVTLASVILAPIFSAVIAIFITHYLSSSKEIKDRRSTVFKNLMRTRGTRLNPEHVGALNLVELEFYKEQNVLNALQRYFDHLNDDTTNAERWIKRTDHLLTKLLSEMAKSLGYEIEQLQLLTGGYIPRAWEDSEQRHIEIQKGLLSVLNGEKAFPVTSNISSKISVPPGFPNPPEV